MAEEELAQSKQPVFMPIRWGSADDIPTLYANQLFVSHAGPEFFLIFGNITAPLLVGEVEKDSLPEFLQVKPVARIAVTREQMLEFAKAIHQNVERFLGRKLVGEDRE